jgi:prepilin peptidase CpaA
MNASQIAGGAVLALVLGASVYTDLRHGKILNKVVLPCVPLGLLIWGLGAGWLGLVFSLEGMAVGSIALAAAAILAWIAPGDAKLILAIGALRGPAFVGSTMILGALIGGIMGVIILAKRRLLGNAAASAAVALGSHLPLSTVWSVRAGRMPYSIAIALGAVAAGLIPLW